MNVFVADRQSLSEEVYRRAVAACGVGFAGALDIDERRWVVTEGGGPRMPKNNVGQLKSSTRQTVPLISTHANLGYWRLL